MLELTKLESFLLSWQKKLLLIIFLSFSFLLLLTNYLFQQAFQNNHNQYVTDILSAHQPLSVVQFVDMIKLNSNNIQLKAQNERLYPLNPKKTLDWIKASKTFSINNQAYQLHYVMLSQNSVIIMGVVCLFILFFLGGFKLTNQYNQKQLRQLKRKAERLKLAATTPNPNIQSVSALVPTLHQLLDELSWSRQEQNRVDKFIRTQTFIDTETGIGNKVYFENRLEALLNLDEQIEQGALIAIRLNGLEDVEYNYSSNDAIAALDQVTQIISLKLEPYPQAVFARYNKQDLGVILPNVSIKNIEQLCSKIQKSLTHIQLPASILLDDFYHIGVALFKAGDKLNQVMSEADMALKAAQLQGHSGWFMQQDRDQTKHVTMGSLQWRTLLEKALNEKKFTLFFQAAINISPRGLNHQEVLVRLKNSEGHIINASLFMPMAQKCGLVTPIDKYVLNNLFNLFKQDDRSNVPCSVNLSVHSLLNDMFANWLVAHLEQHPNHAERLIIELSEHAVSEHHAVLHAILIKLYKLNVRLLIDQVGQYVHGVNYLKQLPVSYLKLHASIIRNIDVRSENQLFIRSLQGTCADTPIKIFAFGLETEAEWQVIKQLKLAGAQGHYFNQANANLLTE